MQTFRFKFEYPLTHFVIHHITTNYRGVRLSSYSLYTANAANSPPIKPLKWPIQLTPTGDKPGINVYRVPP